jgi:hypothetical protein
MVLRLIPRRPRIVRGSFIPRCRTAACYHGAMPAQFEDEETWLRHRVIRLRTILRLARDSRVEDELRLLISEAEARLEVLASRRAKGS